MENKSKKIKELKIGDYFQLVNNDSSPMWVRGEYIRSEKRFSCYKYEDVNQELLIKGEKQVFCDNDF